MLPGAGSSTEVTNTSEAQAASDVLPLSTIPKLGKRLAFQPATVIVTAGMF